MLISPIDEELLVKYRFAVVFLKDKVLDIRFQKVSGLTTQIQTEKLEEGGENIFMHHLPNKVEYSNLVLEKGRMVGGVSSLFNLQINQMFSNAMFNPIDIMVTSLNALGVPVAAWLLYMAYPVKWSVSDLDANENGVIVDTLELAYRKLTAVSI